MEILEVKNLSFTYPKCDSFSLKDVSFSVNEGEFVIISGESGCGKTTLLRLIKDVCSPNGTMTGEINAFGKNVKALSVKENTQIGFVMQNPDNQIVCDNVWEELAFGLENLKYSKNEIRKRVAEVCSFFGMNNYFHRKTSELSGGEKQLLALASVLVMEPKILLFDEATSQLDPIATIDFMNHLHRINDELGITIIMVSHNLDECFNLANRLIILDKGEIIFNEKKEDIINKVGSLSNKQKTIFPVYDRMFIDKGYLPNSISDARSLIIDKFNDLKINKHYYEPDKKPNIIEIKDAYFRYSKDDSDVLRGLNLDIKEGEILSIIGGNGVGKTTLVKVISGIKRLYSGKVSINGKNVNKLSDFDLYHNNISVISQNPYSLFTSDSVCEEFSEVAKIMNNKNKVSEVIDLLKIGDLLNKHPYDLSGGEAQKVALAKMLLFEPKIIILDEATKGLDVYYKEELAKILLNLKASGKTIILVTHDMEFASNISDRCALYFDGEIVSVEEKHKFLLNNSFYTTTVAKVTKGYWDLVTLSDFLEAFYG